MQGGSLYHFYDGLWYDPAERRTHDLPCERRTRYRPSQPDTVISYDYYANRIFSYITDEDHDISFSIFGLQLYHHVFRLHYQNVHELTKIYAADVNAEGDNDEL